MTKLVGNCTVTTRDRVCLGRRLVPAVVDDEDVFLARAEIGNIKEVDMVVGDDHNGVVTAGVGSVADVVPGESATGRSLLLAHIEIPELVCAHGVENVGIMVKDSGKVGRVEAVGGDLLGGPGLGGRVVNIDVGGVLRVSAHDVDGVFILREVASGVSAIKRRATRGGDFGRIAA